MLGGCRDDNGEWKEGGMAEGEKGDDGGDGGEGEACLIS